MTEERRESPRRAAYIAAELETGEGKSSIAITRDISTRGVLMFSRRTLAVGDAVTIKLVKGNESFVIAAKVTRVDTLSPDESTLWRTKVGVVVDDPAMLERLHAALDRPGTEPGH
jgi:hypothetical protein